MASALVYPRYRIRISLQVLPIVARRAERLVPQRRSLAGARVDSVERRNIPSWVPSAITLLAAVCRIGPRLEASPSKAVIKTGDLVCDGCREDGRRRPWREGRHELTDAACHVYVRVHVHASRQHYYCIQHSVTRWRAGIGSRAGDSSMLEQCVTLRLPVLDSHMIALGGSSLCYGGACGCGGNGAISSTCMTARHDRRAHLSHLCCGLCAIRSSWTVGQKSWAGSSAGLLLRDGLSGVRRNGQGLGHAAGPAAAIYRD